MTKTTSTPEATPGLKDAVQALRDKARKILRARMISDVLQNIFDYNKTLRSLAKDAETAAKNVARLEYAITVLDEADPDYETKIKNANSNLDDAKKTFDATTEHIKTRTAQLNDSIDKANTKIADIEDGKVMVSIDEVKDLTDKMIETSL